MTVIFMFTALVNLIPQTQAMIVLSDGSASLVQGICLEGLRKPMRIINRDIHNRKSPEYKTGNFTARASLFQPVNTRMQHSLNADNCNFRVPVSNLNTKQTGLVKHNRRVTEMTA
jgi:hypothetical protein